MKILITRSLDLHRHDIWLRNLFFGVKNGFILKAFSIKKISGEIRNLVQESQFHTQGCFNLVKEMKYFSTDSYRYTISGLLLFIYLCVCKFFYLFM